MFPLLATHDERLRYLKFFPKLCVPWALLAPHEAQAQRNHGQTLERLAERGGLGADEMVAILEDRPWSSVRLLSMEQALTKLLELVKRWKP